MEGTEAELRCVVPDNCPEMKPIVTWTNHGGLEERSVYAQVEEEGSTWSLISLLKFLPSRENHGRAVGCKVSYANTTFEFDGLATLDVKCELCVAEGLLAGNCGGLNVAFSLHSRNPRCPQNVCAAGPSAFCNQVETECNRCSIPSLIMPLWYLAVPIAMGNNRSVLKSH